MKTYEKFEKYDAYRRVLESIPRIEEHSHISWRCLPVSGPDGPPPTSASAAVPWASSRGVAMRRRLRSASLPATISSNSEWKSVFTSRHKSHFLFANLIISNFSIVSSRRPPPTLWKDGRLLRKIDVQLFEHGPSCWTVCLSWHAFDDHNG